MLNRHPRWKLPFPSAWGLAGLDTKIETAPVMHQASLRRFSLALFFGGFGDQNVPKPRRFRPSVLNTRRPSGSLAAPRTTGRPNAGHFQPVACAGLAQWCADPAILDFANFDVQVPRSKTGRIFGSNDVECPWRIQRCRWIPAKTLGCKASTRDAISAAMGRTIIGCRGHASCVQGWTQRLSKWRTWHRI